MDRRCISKIGGYKITFKRKYEKLNKNKCPLCRSLKTEILYKGEKRDNHRFYFHCSECDLVFVNKCQHLNELDELNRYREHNNDPCDKGYIKFLSRLTNKVIPYLKKEMVGLDYGCGPGPALSMIMEDKGYNMEIYDPYFYRRNKVFNEKYDFITCSEVIEHFSNPFGEFIKLNKLLKKDGYLAIMTSLLNDRESFDKWYYKNDFTHISFYSKKTMKWIAYRFNYKIIFLKEDVIIFKKIRGGELSD